MTSDKDNPFADPGDADRTIVRPSPGRRAAAPARPAAAPAPGAPERPVQVTVAPPPAAPRGRDAAPVAVPGEGLNPIIGAAGVLLALAARLRRTVQQPDVQGLRYRIIEQLKLFERRIRLLPAPVPALKGAHYAICATLDDVILSTPWGGSSIWTAQSLVSTFHNEVTGGERFFEILQRLQTEATANIDTLELMYACLALGFEGKYRVGAGGARELAAVRDGLYGVIRKVRGDFERELSPQWRGVPAPHRSLAAKVPVWVTALVACVLLLLVYMGLSFALSDASDPVFAELARLPPRIPTPPAVAAAVTAPTVPTDFLAPQLTAGLVKVKDTPQETVVTLNANGMFASGSATIEPRYVDLLKQVAAEIEAKRPGRVLVIGHTDNVPIRTVRFPSNYALSLARAEAAAAVIKGGVANPDRVSTEGRGDAEPIADNATAAGREANRRIDIVIMKAPAS